LCIDSFIFLALWLTDGQGGTRRLSRLFLSSFSAFQCWLFCNVGRVISKMWRWSRTAFLNRRVVEDFKPVVEDFQAGRGLTFSYSEFTQISQEILNCGSWNFFSKILVAKLFGLRNTDLEQRCPTVFFVCHNCDKSRYYSPHTLPFNLWKIYYLQQFLFRVN